MRMFFSLMCLTALVGSLGCTPAETPPADEVAPGATEVGEVPAVEEGASLNGVPKGKFVQANPKLATLRAKFVYGGKPPERQKLDTSRDPFCAPLEVLSDSMLVSPNGGLKNLVLIFDTRKSEDVPAEQLEVPEKTILLDNNGCQFTPHIIFVRPGQTIEVKNSDATGHNANFTFFRNTSENFLIPAGQSKEKKIEAAEGASLNPVECNIHPWMKAYVVVQEHPYVGISDDEGQIEITNLPVGEVSFYIRHENADGSIEEGTVGGKKEKWSRGKMERELKAGMNDLGTITLAPDQFRQ